MTTKRFSNISIAIWFPIGGENHISSYVFIWEAPCRDADRIQIFTSPRAHVKYEFMTLDGIKKYDPTKELLIFLGDRIRFSGSIGNQTLSKIVEILTGDVFNSYCHIIRSDFHFIIFSIGITTRPLMMYNMFIRLYPNIHFCKQTCTIK